MNRLLRPLAVGLALAVCAEAEPSLAAPPKAIPNYARHRPSKLNLPSIERIVGRLLGDDSPDPAAAEPPAASGNEAPSPTREAESAMPTAAPTEAGQEAAENLPEAQAPTRIRATVAEPDSPTLFRLKPEDQAEPPPTIRSARCEQVEIKTTAALPADDLEPPPAMKLHVESVPEKAVPETDTSDRPSFKEPTPVVRISPPEPAASPAIAKVERRPVAASEAPRTSARTYLADEVRFGRVVRPRYDEKPRAVKPETGLAERAEEPTLSNSPDEPAVAEAETEELEALAAPASLPLAADDLAGHRLLRPLPAASTPLAPTSHEGSAAVSDRASPAEILRTVHTFGAAAPRRPLEAKSLSSKPKPAVPEPAAEPESAESAHEAADAESPRAEDAVSLSLAEPTQPKAAKVLSLPQAASPKPTPQGVRFKVRHGAVARVNRRDGHVVAHFPDSPALPVGSRLQVYRRVFFQRKHVGELEVVESQVQESIARPVGKLGIDDIAPEDELVLVPISNQKIENRD